MADNFSEVLSDATRRSQYLVLGDTDHRETGIVAAATSPEAMRAMAAQGVTHMFMERDANAQKVIDSYQNGDLSFDKMKTALRPYAPAMLGGGAVAVPLSPEQIDQQLDVMADAVRNAKDAGIKMHFMERGAGSLILTEMNQAQNAYIYKVTMDSISAHAAQDPAAAAELADIAVRDSQRKTTPQETQKLEAFMGKWMEEHPEEKAKASAGFYNLNVEAQQRHARARIDADRELAADITKITGAGKGVVLYGAAHGEHVDDLDNHLPNSIRIMIAQNNDGLGMLNRVQGNVMDPSRAPDPKMAEGVFVIEQGRYYRNDAAGVEDICRMPGIDAGKLGMCQLGEPDAPAAPELPAGGPPRMQLRQSNPGGMGGV